MRNLIILRHGKTDKNKLKHTRRLTPDGQLQVFNLASELKNYCAKRTCIYCSPTVRAKETALIISKIVASTKIIMAECRVLGIDTIKNTIEANERIGITPINTYFHLQNYESIGVESPQALVFRWLKLCESCDAETIIIVSHEVTLEAFFYYQIFFKVIYQSFTINFDYADYAILETKHHS